MIELLTYNLLVVMAGMTLLWLVSVILRDASVVDLFWGLGFVGVAWVSFSLTSGVTTTKILLVTMTTIWGLRLSGYLAWRNIGHGEDKRYAEMRTKFGARFWWLSLFIVFWLQGAIMWVVSLPLQVGQLKAPSGMGWLHGIGVAVWSVGFLFEAVGDWQLARFKSRPENQGRVMNRGLWRYTRHPNYFGDFCVWWGLYLVALHGYFSWWTVISPILMSFFLMKVSGVPLLERSMKARSNEYAEYIEQTSSFFPRMPRKSAT